MPPEAAAAAVVLPAADQPPAPAREKPFAERWAAVESTITDDAEDATETPAAETGSSKAAPKAQPKPAGDPKEAKRAQLKTLAEELGLNLDD